MLIAALGLVEWITRLKTTDLILLTLIAFSVLILSPIAVIWFFDRFKLQGRRMAAGTILLVLAFLFAWVGVFLIYTGKKDTSRPSPQAETKQQKQPTAEEIASEVAKRMPMYSAQVAPKQPEVMQPQDDSWKKYDPPERIDRPLLPASDPDPEHFCNRTAPVGATKIYFADWMGWIKRLQEMVVLKIGEVDVIRIKKIGSVAYFSAVFTDGTGNIVARIDDNKIELNIDETYSIQRPDDHEIIVLHKDRRLLQVRYLNRDSLRVAGSFRVPGFQMVEVTSDKILLDGRELDWHQNCVGDCVIGIHFN